MQLFPHAFPAVQILQHSPLGSTDHSMVASSLELGGGFASGSLEPALVRPRTSNAAMASGRNAIFIRARYAAVRVG